MSKPIQQQMARLVWHANYSLKRSLSAVTNAAASAMPAPNPNYSGQGSLNKNWIHPPDALIYGRVEYTVKLLGDVAVEQAKGTEVIKGAIQVLRFNLSVKKSTGFKLQKVELHINVDGVNIVDAKTKMVLHKYPLHRISFCADDKTDKRLFAFIARQQQQSSTTSHATSDGGCGNGGGQQGPQRHHCYVFLSDKLAEEITLTIGEAFDLAYRRFLENNGKDLELKKQSIVLRKRVSDLEMENAELKRQLAQQQRNISSISSSTNATASSATNHQQQSLVDIFAPTATGNATSAHVHPQPPAKSWENFSEFDSILGGGSAPRSAPPPLPTSPMPAAPPSSAAAAAAAAIMHPPPPTPASRKPNGSARQQQHGSGNNGDIMLALSSNGPDVGRRLENLRLNEFEDIFDQEFDPRAGERGFTNPFEAHHQHATAAKSNGTNGAPKEGEAASSRAEPSSEDFEMAISMIDSRLADMRDGFSSGISFGKDEFHVNDFDPFQNPGASQNSTNAEGGNRKMS